MSIDFIALIINGLVTSILGAYIVYAIYVRKFEKHPFYCLFGIGFIVYGVQIFARAFLSDVFFSYLMFCSSIFLFTLGLWSLSRKRFLSVIFIVYSSVFLLMILWKLNLVPDFLVKFGLPIGSTLVHVPLIMLIAYHRVFFGKIADKFVFGWTLLFLTNVATFGMGWITDFFAVFSKLVLLIGIQDYDFVILAQRIRGEIAVRHLPTFTGDRKEGGLKLILPSRSSSNYIKRVNWIGRAILENVEKDISTFLFAFQDVIPHKELRKMKWIKPERVFVFLFSSSAERVKKEFTVLPMGITQIGAALSETVRNCKSQEKGCAVIFLDLSLLIHSFGSSPIYNMLVNKMGTLREGGVDLFAFLLPETHVDKSVVSLFASIADEVIKH